jgi:Spy/CpxP family protein refolding chaperone
MKGRNTNNALAGALIAAVAGVWAASAQPGDPAGPEQRPPSREDSARFERGQPPGGFPGRPALGVERWFGVLTDEQRASLRREFESQREPMRELEEQMRAARREFMEAGLAEKPDEKRIRKKAKAVAKIEGELAVLRAKALANIQPPLSAEQREKLRSAGSEFAPGRTEARPEFRRVPGQPPREEFRRRERSPERDENDLPARPGSRN